MNDIINIPRWTIASFAKHFEDNCVSDSLKMYLEGTARKANKSANYFEFRINGPFIHKLTQIEYKIQIIINLLLVNIVDEQNHYLQNKNQGILVAAFSDTIGMYRYGLEIGDDSSLVDCYYLCPDAGERVKITNFGQLHAETRVMESTVEACYQMYYSVDD